MRAARDGLVCLLLSHAALAAAPNILGADPHLDGETTANASSTVISLLGSGVSAVDYEINTAIPFQETGNTSATDICSYATNPSGGSCGTPVNHAPYFVAAAADTPVTGSYGFDISYYSFLESVGIGIAGGTKAGTNSAISQLPVTVMTVTSTNSLDGNRGTGGYGVDLFLSTSYLGFQTHDDSSDIGVLSGIVSAVADAHPTFNPFDIHGVMRQTASNWATGWSTTGAFGFVNYSAASGTISTIYLQAPNLQIVNHGYYMTATLYPFRSTRRVKEVVYAGGTWPSPATGCSGSTCNEYTAAQIASAGGTLIYTSNGTDLTPTFTYAPSSSMTVTFYALTLDSSGNGSRVEAFAPVAESFIIGTACQR